MLYRSFALPCFLAATVLCVSQTSAADKPNFLIFFVDDYGWSDAGYMGSTFYDTPEIDALAARAMHFTSGYASCPVCSPTRVSLQTGFNPARLATTNWFGAPQPDAYTGSNTKPRFRQRPLVPPEYVPQLPLPQKTIAEYLGDAGYATYFAGKWHLGGEGYDPELQGYDVNIGGYHRGHPRSFFSPYKNPKLPDGPKGEHLPARLARETSDYIKSHADAPFIAVLSFYSVHTPLQGRPDLIEKYKARIAKLDANPERFGKEGERDVRLVQDHPVYGAMVEAMDEAVGEVLEAVEAAGIADDTVVIFTSDNGGLSTAGGSPTSNMPLRAGKGWLYEGGIRVPWIVHYPGVTKPGSKSDAPIITHDVLPTVLEIAGLDADAKLDGKSIMPLLEGADSLAKNDEPRPLFWHYPHYGNQGARPGAAVRRGDWKLIRWFHGDKIELFNLRDDIGETTDLSQEKPELAAELYELLSEWLEAAGARMPKANPNYRAAGA